MRPMAPSDLERLYSGTNFEKPDATTIERRAKERICAWCEAPLTRKDRETKFHFGRRRSCGVQCAMRARPLKPLDVRFWKHVKKTRSCWIWTGTKNSYGYGQIRVDQEVAVGAHIVSWIIAYGALPKAIKHDCGNPDCERSGPYVCHHCDNPACVRPDHLFLGDHVANTADMVKKHRSALGEACHFHRLTWPDVDAIRVEFAAGRSSMSDLARRYGVSQPTISRVVRRVTWRARRSVA